jgi:hypothetical protein
MAATACGHFPGIGTVHLVAQMLDDLFGHWYEQEFHYESQRPLGTSKHLSGLNEARRSPTPLPPSLRLLCTEAVIATGYLRHGAAHKDGSAKNTRKALSVLLASDDIEGNIPLLRDAVKSAAQSLETPLSIPGLSDLVVTWLR